MAEPSPKRESPAPPIKRLHCLTGCTAVGKTGIALDWAEANNAEIVSCDSLLFYKGLDIGTAKPSLEERARVPHHLIDIVEPDQQMDVGSFVDLAISTIREIQSRGRQVLATGGSGFYLKAFFAAVVDGVTVSERVRATVAEIMEKGLPVAVAELGKRNPNGLGNLDTNNPRRVVKALERCIETGATLAELQEDFMRQSNALVEADKRLTVIERETDELNRRIDSRVEQMLASGLVEEVEGLLRRGFERNASASNSIGYRETIAYLKGEYDRDQLREKIATNTRRLAKKQRTWFRGQLPVDARRIHLSEGCFVGLDALFSE